MTHHVGRRRDRGDAAAAPHARAVRRGGRGARAVPRRGRLLAAVAAARVLQPHRARHAGRGRAARRRLLPGRPDMARRAREVPHPRLRRARAPARTRTPRAGRGATCTCSSSTIRWRRCPGWSACSGAGRIPIPGESDTVWSASQPITDPVSGLETSGPGDAVRGEPRRPRRELLMHLRRAVGPPGQRALRRPARGLAGRPDAQAELVRRGDRAQPRRHPHARPGLACRRRRWCSRWPRRSSMRRGTC